MITDHQRQMNQEKPEAICPSSPTERHFFQIAYDQNGRSNHPAAGEYVICEGCRCPIKGEGARWVKVAEKDEHVPPWLLHRQLVITEEETIEDIL